MAYPRHDFIYGAQPLLPFLFLSLNGRTLTNEVNHAFLEYEVQIARRPAGVLRVSLTVGDGQADQNPILDYDFHQTPKSLIPTVVYRAWRGASGNGEEVWRAENLDLNRGLPSLPVGADSSGSAFSLEEGNGRWPPSGSSFPFPLDAAISSVAACSEPNLANRCDPRARSYVAEHPNARIIEGRFGRSRVGADGLPETQRWVLTLADDDSRSVRFQVERTGTGGPIWDVRATVLDETDRGAPPATPFQMATLSAVYQACQTAGNGNPELNFEWRSAAGPSVSGVSQRGIATLSCSFNPGESRFLAVDAFTGRFVARTLS